MTDGVPQQARWPCALVPTGTGKSRQGCRVPRGRHWSLRPDQQVDRGNRASAPRCAGSIGSRSGLQFQSHKHVFTLALSRSAARRCTSPTMGVTHTGPNMSDTLPPSQRSAGFNADEVLDDAERRARRPLGRRSTAGGATLVAGWPTLLRAAAEVLDPHDTVDTSASPTGPLDPPRCAEPWLWSTGWRSRPRPSEVPRAHRHPPGVELIVEGWQHAAVLLRRPGSQDHTTPLSTSHTSVGSAVDMRIVSTLTVVALVNSVGASFDRRDAGRRPALTVLHDRVVGGRSKQVSPGTLRQPVVALATAPPASACPGRWRARADGRPRCPARRCRP